jgi:hypothetical protein
MRIFIPAILLSVAPLAMGAAPPQGQLTDQTGAQPTTPAITQHHMEMDLRTPDQQGSIYLAPDPAPGADDPSPVPFAPRRTFYLVGPGFRARVDHLEFRMVPDSDQSGSDSNADNSSGGKLVMVIPANTVFDLTPVAQRYAPPRIWVRRPAPIRKGDGPAATPVAANPIAGQIDGRVAAQVDGRATAPAHEPTH